VLFHGLWGGVVRPSDEQLRNVAFERCAVRWEWHPETRDYTLVDLDLRLKSRIVSAGTCTGEAWACFGVVVCRDEEPKQFWSLVASYYLGGPWFYWVLLV